MWNWLLLWNTDWAYTLRFWWRRVQTALKCTLSYRDGFTCISALLCWFCCPSFAQILQTVLHSVAFRIQVFAFVMLRLLPDILTNASNQDPTMGTGEKDQTSRTRFWIWVAGSRSGSERRLHGALLLLASGDGQHFRATYAASQCKVERDTNIHEPLYTNHDLLATRQVNVKVLFLKNISCSAGRTSKKFWICFWRAWRMMLPPYVRLAFKALGWGLELHGFAMRLFELQAAQTITKHFGSSHTALLLPPLEEASFGQLMSCRNKHLQDVVICSGLKVVKDYRSKICDDHWWFLLFFCCFVSFPLDQGVFDVAWLIRHGAVQLMGQLPHPQRDHHPLRFWDAFFMSGMSQNWMTLQIRKDDLWKSLITQHHRQYFDVFCKNMFLGQTSFWDIPHSQEYDPTWIWLVP